MIPVHFGTYKIDKYAIRKKGGGYLSTQGVIMPVRVQQVKDLISELNYAGEIGKLQIQRLNNVGWNVLATVKDDSQGVPVVRMVVKSKESGDSLLIQNQETGKMQPCTFDYSPIYTPEKEHKKSPVELGLEIAMRFVKFRDWLRAAYLSTLGISDLKQLNN